MNGAAAKATRRQLRRSVGETALGAITEQGARVASLDTTVGTIYGHLRTQADETAVLMQFANRFRALTFWQRLTWLVTGSIHGLS